MAPSPREPRWGVPLLKSVTAYLVRIADGSILWHNEYDRGEWQGLIFGPLNKAQGIPPAVDVTLTMLLRSFPKDLPR